MMERREVNATDASRCVKLVFGREVDETLWALGKITGMGT